LERGQLPDQELVRRFRDGDSTAFEALVERHTATIFNFAVHLLGDPADASDATQQTFIQLFASARGWRQDAPFRAWLLRIARNKCIDLLRRRRAVPMSELTRGEEAADLDPADADPLPEEIYERAELQQAIQAAIDALPFRNREVVLLRYLGGLTFAEVAESLGIPENTAKTLFQRAKSQLRRELGRYR